MVYTNTWNTAFEAAPQDANDVGDGAQEIRTFKLAIRERIAKDHYLNISGTDADHGEHEAITLRNQASDPANSASKGRLYVKTANGLEELYYRDSGGTVTQMTSNGRIGTNVKYTDVLSEFTADNGITVDGMQIKDGQILTANACPANTIPNYSLDETKISNAARKPSLVTGENIAPNVLTPNYLVMGSSNISPAEIDRIDGTAAGKKIVSMNTVSSVAYFDITGLADDYLYQIFMRGWAGGGTVSLLVNGTLSSITILNAPYYFVTRFLVGGDSSTGRVALRGEGDNEAYVTASLSSLRVQVFSGALTCRYWVERLDVG